MTGVLFRNGRRDSFVYPVHPAPRTAILVPWFHENAFENRPLRVFRDGWNEDAAAFAPAAVAGTFEQLKELARSGIPSLTHSIIVLWRAGEPRLSEADRDTLWAAFRVPVFEQVIGKSGKRLAAECEAHDGLHIESPALPLENECVEDAPCPCGRKTPRIGVIAGSGFRAPHRGLRSLTLAPERQATGLPYSARNFLVSRKKISSWS